MISFIKLCKKPCKTNLSIVKQVELVINSTDFCILLINFILILNILNKDGEIVSTSSLKLFVVNIFR